MKSLPVTDFSKGLSISEAKSRLKRFGMNEFEERREFSSLDLLVSQFKSPLIYVLFLAGIATVFLREWVEASVIFMVVVVNALLGFWQERKAARSLEALKNYLKPKVIVRREGKRMEVLMKEIVPGDVCYLDTGGSVPADGVVLESELMVVNEAILTGESRPVSKSVMEGVSKKSFDMLIPPAAQDKGAVNFVYMGTSVSSGLGEMLVVRTGNETEMGKIAKSLVMAEEEATPLQIKLDKLARVLMYVVVTITGAIMAIGLWRGEDLVEMFEMAIAVAVAAIPEGLAVSMTVILALGMQRILRKKALVRKLVAAETLGSVSVICCDKTGTLTEGKMKVVDYVGDRDNLIRASVLANDERDEEGLAMVDWVKGQLKDKGVGWMRRPSVERIRDQFERVGAIPFDSANKYMASLNWDGNKRRIVMVGAPEVVLEKCELDKEKKRAAMDEVLSRASQGYRLIGMASLEVGKTQELSKASLKNLKWHGFLVFEDPIRKNVKQALSDAGKAGVGVKVITGDYKETAMAVLKRLLNFDNGELHESQVLTGDELSKMSKADLKSKIGQVVLFARTTPDQKLKIVEVLKEMGEVVAMTGDGVNDAPALKVADIGVVVNEASDVSKQTADMVLLNSNFKTIIGAISEGRVIYDTMRKIVTYLLGSAFQELVLIGGSLLLNLPLPLSAVQILWVNLIEDGLPGLALAFDLKDEGVMEEGPRSRHTPILDGEIKTLLVVIGLVSNVVLLILYYLLLNTGYSFKEVQTFMFVSVSINSLMYIFSIKSLRRNIWDEDLFDNKFLLLAVGAGFGIMLATLYVPFLRDFVGVSAIGWVELLGLTGLSLLTIVMIEIAKYVFIRKMRSGGE